MENDKRFTSSVLVGEILRIRSRDDLNGFVKQVPSQFCDRVSFAVGVVVVHVAHTLYGGQFQTQIVAENTVVASFGTLVAFLDRAKRLVEQNNLVTCFSKTTLCLGESKSLVK